MVYHRLSMSAGNIFAPCAQGLHHVSHCNSRIFLSCIPTLCVSLRRKAILLLQECVGSQGRGIAKKMYDSQVSHCKLQKFVPRPLTDVFGHFPRPVSHDFVIRCVLTWISPMQVGTVLSAPFAMAVSGSPPGVAYQGGVFVVAKSSGAPAAAAYPSGQAQAYTSISGPLPQGALQRTLSRGCSLESIQETASPYKLAEQRARWSSSFPG